MEPERSGPDQLTDAQLVERIQKTPDDWRAFEALVRRHQVKVLTNCRYLSRSTSDAEDLAQEVFVKLFFGLPKFEGRSSLRTWLHRLKLNHCLNFLSRRHQERVFVPATEPGLEGNPSLQTQPTAERDLAGNDERTLIRTILDGMGDTQRVPLVMRDLDGLSYQEIAELLGIGLSAVKMRIRRGREEFRERYAQESARRTGSGNA